MRISDWSSDVCSADLFREVLPGGVRRDEDFLRHGAPAPALTLWRAPLPDDVDSKGKPKPWSAGRSRELATQACVAALHRVLCDARDGHASIEGRPVQPGDIAVLVRSHNEATRHRHPSSEARRGGHEGVSTWRSRWAP